MRTFQNTDTPWAVIYLRIWRQIILTPLTRVFQSDNPPPPNIHTLPPKMEYCISGPDRASIEQFGRILHLRKNQSIQEENS